MFELKINRDIDVLTNEIEHRRRNMGRNLEEVQRSQEKFRDIAENLDVAFYTIWVNS